MKSIELMIILMALSSNSATASHDSQARTDADPSPPARVVPAKAVTRASPAGKGSVDKHANSAKPPLARTSANLGDQLASTP